MEEAQRLLTVSVWKLYRCRLRRGGLRLHRSLQLSLLVRAARHRYLSARAAAETLPGLALAGDIASGATPERGGPPSDSTGDPRNAQPNRLTGEQPNRPTGEQPNRPTDDPRTDQKCPPWNPLRDWSGEPPNRSVGAPRSEWDRSCAPSPPTEDPPSAPTGDRLAPRTSDPADRYQDPPSAAPAAPRSLGAPRAGRKRRSSGSAGPGRGPVPSKRARLEAEAPPLPPGPPGRCSGPPAAAFGFLVRAVGAC